MNCKLNFGGIMQLSSITQRLCTAGSYLVTGTKATGSYALSGIKTGSSYGVTLAKKVGEVALRALSGAKQYAGKTVTLLKNNPKIALITVGTGAVATVAYLAYRHFYPAQSEAADEPNLEATVLTTLSKEVEVTVENLEEENAEDTPENTKVPLFVKGEAKAAAKFLKEHCTKAQISEAIEATNSKGSLKLANWIIKNSLQTAATV